MLFRSLPNSYNLSALKPTPPPPMKNSSPGKFPLSPTPPSPNTHPPPSNSLSSRGTLEGLPLSSVPNFPSTPPPPQRKERSSTPSSPSSLPTLPQLSSSRKPTSPLTSLPPSPSSFPNTTGFLLTPPPDLAVSPQVFERAKALHQRESPTLLPTTSSPSQPPSKASA